MIRGRILVLSLLIMGGLAALLAIAQMWLSPLEWDYFIKILSTLVILGTAVSFIAAADYDLPGSRNKACLAALVVLCLAGAGLLTEQIWWAALSWDIFIKSLITIVILSILLSFIIAVGEDFGSNKKLKDEKYID